MIRFIVVDDDEDVLDKTRNLIKKETFKYDDDIKIYTFKKYDKELSNLINNTDSRTIYILDIELDGKKSGIEIASLIRENDWDSEIIFITNHDKMFETTYRSVYEVFDFIEKYHNMESRLKKDIKIILNKKVDKKMFVYKGRNIDLQLYLNSINYIYRDKEDRKVVIVTDSSSFSIGLGVKEILEKLDNRFKMVHRSCIVNTDRVESYDWNNLKIVMKNGEEILYLSKKYKKEILDHD